MPNVTTSSLDVWFSFILTPVLRSLVMNLLVLINITPQHSVQYHNTTYNLWWSQAFRAPHIMLSSECAVVLSCLVAAPPYLLDVKRYRGAFSAQPNILQQYQRVMPGLSNTDCCVGGETATRVLMRRPCCNLFPVCCFACLNNADILGKRVADAASCTVSRYRFTAVKVKVSYQFQMPRITEPVFSYQRWFLELK